MLIGLISTGCQWMSNSVGRKSIESRELSDRARLAQESGNYRQASRLLVKAIEADPLNADLHRKLGRAHLANGEPAAGVAELQYAATSQPDNIEIQTELAQAYLAQGDKRRAMAAVDRALELDNSHISAISLRAKLLELNGRNREAENAYLRILELDRENTLARLRLGLARLQAGKPEQAAPLLRSVCQCEQAPPVQRAEARWALGIAYGRIGRWEESSESLASALPRLTRPTASEWYHLAYAQKQAGNDAGARINLSRSLQIDPRHPEARRLAERMQLRLGPLNADGVRYAAAQIPDGVRRRPKLPIDGHR